MLKKFYLECYHNTNKMSSNPNFVFFGTSEFAVKILDKLIENGYIPSLVVTTPDKPKGRKMIMTPPPVKVFAQCPPFIVAEIQRPVAHSIFHFKRRGKDRGYDNAHG